ncbi:MAG: CGLD27 family protein [Gomphosphaeria aponina SAG 52.96 = DSM 107014]|uniref:CGLD27 family protein n=1 Tax=Gomphosphaeria aponina SAG 52.96 = DSM 107014 TaxID=1521640 RepID=A0A941JVF4_9CHRO|nr:CGLD27 family protein [Gomphosphaeria aponina SAG 52.96 = DSM 107014]
MTKYAGKFCPVPQEQQPINEYEQLKESWFFRLPTLEQYWQKLGWVLAWGWIIFGVIASGSFNPEKKPVMFALSATLGAGFFVCLVQLRLYLGWYYIGTRLREEKVFYEESGWYDGQIWEKPPAVITRDRLIASYQVDPILARIRQSSLFLGICILTGSLIWLWLK